jgi:hypothetical protein
MQWTVYKMRGRKRHDWVAVIPAKTADAAVKIYRRYAMKRSVNFAAYRTPKATIK